MDFDELGFGEGLAFALEVEDLAADELAGASGKGEFEEVFFCGVSLGVGCLGEDSEGFGEEGVAGEDGHAFAVDFMAGGAATAEVVVVHAGEVIVDEGVGVHDLDGASGGEGFVDVAPAGFIGGESEDGAESLASGKNGVAHGLVDGLGLRGFAGEELAKSRIDLLLAVLEVGFEIGHEEGFTGSSRDLKLKKVSVSSVGNDTRPRGRG